MLQTVSTPTPASVRRQSRRASTRELETVEEKVEETKIATIQEAPMEQVPVEQEQTVEAAHVSMKTPLKTAIVEAANQRAAKKVCSHSSHSRSLGSSR